jgi:hypothetical protein
MRVMLYSKVSYKAFWALRQHGRWRMGDLSHAYQERAEAARGCPLARQYTLSEARELFRDLGLNVLEIRKAHIFTWDIEEYKRGRFVPDAAWEGISEAEIQQLEPELGQHILIRAR